MLPQRAWCIPLPAADIVVIGFESQDGEDGDGGVDRGSAVHETNHHGILLTVVTDATENRPGEMRCMIRCLCIAIHKFAQQIVCNIT